MATISTAIKLFDGVTGPLRTMRNTFDSVIGRFERMKTETAEAVNVPALISANNEIAVIGDQWKHVKDNINAADQAQRVFTRDISDARTAAETLADTLKRAAAALGAAKLVKLAVETSDIQAGTQARLNMLVTDNDSVQELEQKIMASAQRSRAAYFDTAAAVTRLGQNAGKVFDHNNNQIIAFLEQVNKRFVVSGASAQEAASAMTQLSQAMAAGALRGDELNSIMESAPSIARAIENYMGIAEGSIKQYAEQGAITAEVIKNAMFKYADEVDQRFSNMPMTWAQVWTQACNIAIQAFNPLLEDINWMANNLNAVIPILVSFGTAYTVFFVAANWTKLAAAATTMYTGAVTMLKIAYYSLTGATEAATIAQAAYNSVMLANPVAWVIILLAAFVGTIYLVVAAINKVKGTSINATGIICAQVAYGAASIANVGIGTVNFILRLWNNMENQAAGVVEWVVNVFNGGFDNILDS